MAKTKRKISLKAIISIVVVIGIVAALAVGLSSFAKDENKTIKPKFITGSVKLDGEHVNGEKSIVTEDVFSCYGLTVTPDFNSHSTYQIFWYNMDKIAMGSTGVLKGVFAEDIPECAKYCRIVITPDKDTLGDDDKINFWEISGIANDLKIEVAKDQSVLPVNYFKAAQAKTAPDGHAPVHVNERYQFYPNYCYWAENETFLLNMNPSEGSYAIKLDCSNVASYKVFFEENACANFGYGLIDNDGNAVGYGMYVGGIPGREVIIDLSKSIFNEGSTLSDVKYIVFGISNCEIPPVINTYMPR